MARSKRSDDWYAVRGLLAEQLRGVLANGKKIGTGFLMDCLYDSIAIHSAESASDPDALNRRLYKERNRR